LATGSVSCEFLGGDEHRDGIQDLPTMNSGIDNRGGICAREKNDFARNVAVYSYLFRKRYADKLDAQAEQFLHYMVEGAPRMGLHLSDLLGYTQAAQIKQELEISVRNFQKGRKESIF